MTDRSKVQDILSSQLTVLQTLPTATQVGSLPNHDDLAFAYLDLAITAILYVSPNGDNSDGSTWAKAFNEIQDALDACSTDANDLTLVLVAPQTGSNYYDINRSGDPEWFCNVVLAGSHRNWVKIRNTHESATSIAKFSGLTSLQRLNFNLGDADVDAVKINSPAFRVNRCQFVGEDLTGAAIALALGNGEILRKFGIVEESIFKGDIEQMTAISINKVSCSIFRNNCYGLCNRGILQNNEESDNNRFFNEEFTGCNVALDLNAGNACIFNTISFFGCTTNIDDEVGDHMWNNINGEFPITVEPDNFSGVTVDTHANANTWGADTELRAAATSTKPFKIVQVFLEADASEKFRIRFSADSGSTFFADIQFEGTANVAQRRALPFTSSTDFIFNQGTRISASTKSESGGDTVLVWINVEEI